MPDRPTPDLAESLARAVQAEDLETAARLLAGLDDLLALPSQTKAVEYLEQGGEPPEVLGATTAEGMFVPFYFTDGDHALAYLRDQGRVADDDEAMLLMSANPARRVRDSLERGFGGIVLNPRSSHAAVLDRDAVRALSGMLKGPAPAAGAGSPADAADGGGETPAAEGAAPPDGAAAVERTAEPEGQGAGSPEEILLSRVERAPTLDPVPPPGNGPEECRERFQELRREWDEDGIPAWRLLDGLGFELAVHVPVRPEPVFGLRWPLVSPHPDDPGQPAVRVFTHPDDAASALAELPDVETVHLSGVEALRWIWASPGRIEGVVFDLYPGAPGHLTIPDTWALAVLYPHFLDYSELERVERVPLGRLGELPGARGLKAETVRALTERWSDLVTLEPGEGEPPLRVERDGRRYLPAFTSPDRYFDFDSAHPDRSAAPHPAGDAAPFQDWLVASTECDGVLLDPESRRPLPLDHTDLAMLALWTGTGRRPDATDLVVGVESARQELGERIAGRIVADWPRYYWAIQRSDGDTPDQAMTLPRRDACPVFTSEEKVGRFLAKVREWELVGEEMKPAMYLSGWAFNAFREMAGRYREGGWINPRAMRILESLSESGGMLDGAFDAIDPDASDGDGLEVTPAMARAALERIDERLMPRVPGFVA